MCKEINDCSFDNEVIHSDKLVLVDFFSPTCGSCKIVEKILKEIEGELVGKAKVFKMNVCTSPSTSSAYSIMSVPTVIAFKNGRIIGHLIGQGKEQDYLAMV